MIDPLIDMEPLIEPVGPRRRERGQIILLFAGAMVVILGMAGLLIDGGFLLSAQRQAQAAADTGALAAAKAASTGGNASIAARTLADTNGYPANLVDCDGATQANQGVVVNRPPLDGMFAGDSSYVEVITSRAEQTLFAPALGMPCFVVRARAVALISSTTVATCSFCSLSGWADKYTLLLDNGNDLRIDGDLRSSQDTWYTGTMAVNRCGANPCSAPTCGDWNPSPGENRILMCGQSLYVDHSGGATPTTLSARTISVLGGWQARNENDIVHADELGPICPAHPRNLNYPPALQETNVCIGVPALVDPLNDPLDSSSIMPEPDYAALSSCAGPPYCAPVASTTCVAEPGSTLRLPTGTLAAPNKLTINNAGKSTICPGLYFGGFATNGDNGPQPHIIMLPGTYVMVGGGFSVTGTASITSVSSRGDGVTIYNSGGQEAFAENFPSDPGLIPTTCPPPIGSACSSTANTVLNPPSTASRNVGVAIPYKLTLTRGSGLPVPTGDDTYFTFYNGPDPIACEGGIIVSSTATTLAATCTTRYTSFGSKGITAVYAGDSVYEPSGDMKTQVITAQPGSALDNVLLTTNDNTGSCAAPPCGVVQLHAPTTGRYSGLLIFQQRAIGLNQGNVGVEIEPRYGVTDPGSDPDTGAPVPCTGNWMTDGVPPDIQDVPDPCGALGGLSGTIYAPHVASGGPSDWDAVVNIRASGLANLQIIAAEIHFTQVGNQARFAYDPSLFANGAIRLVE